MPEPEATAARTRQSIVADGIFEIVLGVLLATSPLTGLEAAMGLPPPAYRPVVVGLGVLLIPVGAGLIGQARRAGRTFVVGLAAGNVASAGVFGAWLVALWPRFAPVGAGVVAVTVAALLVVGVLEAWAVRRVD